MEPFITLALVTAAVRLVGVFGVRRLRSWQLALRWGFAAMFVLTGLSHFVGMREELIAMVPSALPAAGLLVTVTGILELAGAVGLVLRRTHRLAAACLGLLLVAMFPANVHAAIEGGEAGPMDALLPRTLLQIIFVAVAVLLAIAPRWLRSGADDRGGDPNAGPNEAGRSEARTSDAADWHDGQPSAKPHASGAR